MRSNLKKIKVWQWGICFLWIKTYYKIKTTFFYNTFVHLFHPSTLLGNWGVFTLFSPLLFKNVHKKRIGGVHWDSRVAKRNCNVRHNFVFFRGFLPAPPILLLYSQKRLLYPYLSEWVKVVRDAVNFIYCVSNLLHPQLFFVLAFRFFSSAFFSNFALILFCVFRGPSDFLSFIHSFIVSSGGPSGLYHFYVFF